MIKPTRKQLVKLKSLISLVDELEFRHAAGRRTVEQRHARRQTILAERQRHERNIDSQQLRIRATLDAGPAAELKDVEAKIADIDAELTEIASELEAIRERAQHLARFSAPLRRTVETVMTFTGLNYEKLGAVMPARDAIPANRKDIIVV